MHHTEVLHINSNHPNAFIIERAASLLRAGQVVVFPTETVYGLGGDAMQGQALERIFAAKERPYSDPLIVHIADKDALEMLVTTLPASAKTLAQAFWPGPLTMILPANPRVPKLVTAGLSTVAVRMPRHAVALALIRATGSPIAAPSANRFMHVSPTSAQHALADLDGRVPLILDGGPCVVGVESTILDLTSSIPTILRPGGVSLEALQHVLPEVIYRKVISNDRQSEHIVQNAPGQLLTHYAPRVPTFLFEGSTKAMNHAMLAEIQRRQAQGERVGVLIADEDIATFAVSGARIYTLGSANEPEQIATRLFAGLRTLEEADVQSILCRSFTEQGLGLAIRDRLRKAAGGKIISVSLD
ncbi:MAG: L-threonylcarbamoyladenylate synthase [Ktedonobacteraceae bacterium]